MARDILAEITAKQNRKGKITRPYSPGLWSVERLWLEGDGPLVVAPEFVVIRLVTVLEVFTRSWLAEIVDKGEPYIGRAANLVRGDLKIDYAMAQALVGHSVTFGDLVSHTVSVNRLADIDALFSSLLDLHLFTWISEVLDRRDLEAEAAPAVQLNGNVDSVRARLVQLFELRHVLVHELPGNLSLTPEDTTAFVRAAVQFVNACEQAFHRLLYGEYPLTQAAMNISAREAAEAADAELIEVLSQLDPAREDEQLLATQEAWETYRVRQCEYRSGIHQAGHGSIATLLYASEWDALTRKRIKEIRWYIERQEGEM